MVRSRHSTLAEDSRRIPLGATPVENGCFFAVWSRDASAIFVHLYDRQERETSVFSLGERRGGLWFGFAEGVKPGELYAIEARGEENFAEGHYFKTGRLLADPYAKAFNRQFIFNAETYANDSAKFMPKAVVPDLPGSFDWQGISKPLLHRDGLILYETNVRGLTMLNPEVPERERGTYLGVVHPSVIKHLKHLGVSAVQFNPVAAAMSEPQLTERGLSNYWGYNPVCFMAPDARFAVDPLNSVAEFKTMVRELHRAGIGVILDVVYNHTAEGGMDGPVLNLKGLDCRRYYSFTRREDGSGDFLSYFNVTGCGNSYNCDHRVALNLVMDSLGYWVDTMQVDGFRFDLAVTLNRETHLPKIYEFEPNSGFLKACFCNDLTSGSLLIAEPWDIGHDGYRLGQFSHGWSEQNDRFRDNVRKFWRGDDGQMAEFATRIMGSRDIFVKGARSIHASVNYVTYHDGFTLEDLVSYQHKHNEANGHNNDDGSWENYSTNCGVEGPTSDPEILKKRWQLKRNLMSTVLLSQGIPHLLAGDEFSRTQHGNNNAYCQDNEISWIHWDYTRENREFIEFIHRLTTLRRESSLLSEIDLADDTFHMWKQRHFADWYLPNGMNMEVADWEDPKLSAMMLHAGDNTQKDGEQWCFLFNRTNAQMMFTPPHIDGQRQWVAVLDTSMANGEPHSYNRICGMSVECQPNSIIALALAYQDEIDDTKDHHGLLRHASRSGLRNRITGKR